MADLIEKGESLDPARAAGTVVRILRGEFDFMNGRALFHSDEPGQLKTGLERDPNDFRALRMKYVEMPCAGVEHRMTSPDILIDKKQAIAGWSDPEHTPKEQID